MSKKCWHVGDIVRSSYGYDWEVVNRCDNTIYLLRAESKGVASGIQFELEKHFTWARSGKKVGNAKPKGNTMKYAIGQRVVSCSGMIYEVKAHTTEGDYVVANSTNYIHLMKKFFIECPNFELYEPTVSVKREKLESIVEDLKEIQQYIEPYVPLHSQTSLMCIKNRLTLLLRG